MRQGRDNGFLFNDDNKIIAINLGADYCAEHEWGIKGLHYKFGFGEPSKMGLQRRQVTKNPVVMWLDKVPFKHYAKKTPTNFSGFIFSDYHRHDNDAVSMLTRQAHPGDKELITLWDENSFAALSSSAEGIANLKEIHAAFDKPDIAIWRGGSGSSRMQVW
jgi:hypothetical protein